MRVRYAVFALVAAGLAAASVGSPAQAVEGLWRRTISYQDKNDLFYNYYEGPDPSGTAAAMYVSPRPVPVHVGHTYTTYQPLMPHEYLYSHTRSHYAHVPGRRVEPGEDTLPHLRVATRPPCVEAQRPAVLSPLPTDWSLKRPVHTRYAK